MGWGCYLGWGQVIVVLVIVVLVIVVHVHDITIL